MSLYAEGTGVAESKSKIEIDDMLRKWKASSCAIGEDRGEAVVIFAIGGWHVRFRCPMPDDALAVAFFAKKLGRYNFPSATQKAAWIEQPAVARPAADDQGEAGQCRERDREV